MVYDLAREQSYPTPLASSALLTLMLMSLANQQNAPKRLQSSASIYPEYDYIIVGAGSAGSTLASRLSEAPCVSVLLLEAGGAAPLLNDIPVLGTSFFRTDLDWNYTTVPQKHTARLMKNRQLDWFSGKGFGGTSLLGCNLYVRGTHKNYNDWAKQGALGWSYDDVLPYFKKIEDYKSSQHADNGYHSVNGPVKVEFPNHNSRMKHSIVEAVKELGYEFVDINGVRQTGFCMPEATVSNGQRCSTAKAYLVPAENRSNLHILPYAFVHKVLIENNKAKGVSFEISGTMQTVKAKKEVILSAGTVNTAQLLMLSGIGPKDELAKHGITVVSDLPVGKNFHDHSSTVSNFELGADFASVDEQLMDDQNIKDYIDHRKGPYASLEFTVTMAFLRGLSVKPSVDDPTYQLYLAEISTGIGGSLIDSAFQQVYGPYEDKPLYTCAVQLTQPKSRGSVRLNSLDPHDPPLIDPNHYESKEDLADVVSGLKVCHQIGTSEAMKKIGSKPFNTTYPGCEKYLNNQNKLYRCMAKSYVLTSNHQVGTAKMGDPKDPSTVVDPQLRVKNIEGLRVVDASIMPIIPSGNPNIPTIMVAEKAADIIKQTITCPSTHHHLDL